MKPEDVPEKWHRAVVAAYIALGAAPDGPEEVDIPSHNDVAFILAAVIPAIQAEALERAAAVVENGQETHLSTADGDSRFLTPRRHGNLAGLAFAAAIRAMKEPGT